MTEGEEGIGFVAGNVCYVATKDGDKLRVVLTMELYELMKDQWQQMIHKGVAELNRLKPTMEKCGGG